MCSECRRREQVSFQLSGDANSRTGPCFLHISILPPHAHAYFLAGVFLLLSSVSESQRASFQLAAATRKFLPNSRQKAFQTNILTKVFEVGGTGAKGTSRCEYMSTTDSSGGTSEMQLFLTRWAGGRLNMNAQVLQ